MRLCLKSTLLFLVLFSSCVSSRSKQAAEHSQNDLSWVKDVGARKSPGSNKIFWVNNYGSVNDSNSVCTNTIQKAIDDCSAQGGGIVAFKPGTFLTASIFLKDNVHL